MGGVMGAPGGQSQGVDSYTAVNTYSEDTSLDGDSIESTGTDENTVLVDSGANVSIKTPPSPAIPRTAPAATTPAFTAWVQPFSPQTEPLP